MLIQDSAIGTDLGRKFVLVLDADGKVAYRGIEPGPKLHGLRIVRSGLGKDDRIVVNGLQRAMPGMPVDAQDVPMADERTLAALASEQDALKLREQPRVTQADKHGSPRG